MNEKFIKTYGVRGMLEWHTVIRAGRSSLRVRFEGGALSGYGVTPAEFTTSSPVAQHIIEHSREFRHGKITILRSVPAARHNQRRPDAPERTVAAETIGKTSADIGIGAGRERIRLGCREDAREWLISCKGVAASRLKSFDAIMRQAAALGVEFEFDDSSGAGT